MKRRDFLKTSVTASATAATTLAASAAAPSGPEYYELRTWSLKAAKQALLDTYLRQALLPALIRFGLGPVGCFVELQPNDEVKVHALITYSSPEQFATLSARLAGDAAYQQAGAEYLNAKASDPVYSRIESSFMAAIEGLPKLVKPDPTKSRLFNLRIYESHNERAGKKKIEMFNRGELAIFKRTGLTPVMFAETLSGTLMPNLTYLLVFPDDDTRKKAWDTFRADPEWLKLKAVPEYADKEIVLKVTNRLLTPTPYSEL
ncbi:MAG: NIPSNAP family containing protein [Proteobacteria bacterium]|nr:NIPSNAP family containing protein [Pseudomonadota bacterium]